MEIRQVEAKLYMLTRGRTWRREYGYANTPNNECRPVTETQHVNGTRQYTYASSTLQLKIHSTSSQYNITIQSDNARDCKSRCYISGVHQSVCTALQFTVYD